MRTILFVTGILLAGLTSLQAEFKIPRGVYTLDKLAEAQAEAKKKQQPITFMSTDSKGDCPLCDGASMSSFREFGRFSTIVILESKQQSAQWANYPKVVKEALNSPAAGNIIPLLVLTNSEADKHLATVPYAKLKKDTREAAREAKKTLKKLEEEKQKED